MTTALTDHLPYSDKRLHADGAISVGLIVTRGRSMQDDMRATVLRFARERGVASNDDLREIGLVPTPRQQRGVETRMRTSGVDFAEAWSALFVADKYGAATTQWSKLEDRVRRGVGNPCPLVLIGLPSICESAWNKAPVFGVIGVQTGPL